MNRIEQRKKYLNGSNCTIIKLTLSWIVKVDRNFLNGHSIRQDPVQKHISTVEVPNKDNKPKYEGEEGVK